MAELEDLGGKGGAHGEEPPHVTEAKRICLDGGMYLKPDGKCFRKLVRILLDILGETYRWELECISTGEDCFFYPKALDNLLGRLASVGSPPSAPMAVRSITIVELFEQYKAYLRPRGITEKSLEEYNVPMRLMTEFLGNVAIHTLTFDDFERIRECFMQLPVRKGKKYQGKSFKECIEIAKREGDAPLNAYTLNNYLDKIKAVFAFAEETKKISSSPVGLYRVSKKVLKGRGVDSIKRESFSNGDLEKIFSIPCYTGCMGRGRQNASGQKIIHNEKFWVPLIALFSGARLGEISQLGCSQISSIDGIPCFQISDDMSRQSLKTDESKRVVPLHSMLIDLGLLNYVEHASRESDFLFPALISRGRQ